MKGRVFLIFFRKGTIRMNRQCWGDEVARENITLKISYRTCAYLILKFTPISLQVDA